jgi:hypothetical protein
MRSRNHGPSPGLTALRHPIACTPLARRLTHWPSPPQDAAATHLHTGLGHATPLRQRDPHCPLCQLWTCQTGHQSRRHPGYVTALGRDYRGCLRLHNVHGAGDPGRPVTTPPARARTLRSAPPQAPSSEGTQRDEPAQVGRVHPKPPRCSPFGDASGVRNP